MYYPLNCVLKDLYVAPLFGDQLIGEPHVFDFSSKNPDNLNCDPAKFYQFQEYVFSELDLNKKFWGVGKYLEERSSLLRFYPQMIEEERVIHLGLDIIVPAGFKLFSPISGKVHLASKEEGLGNFGGIIILEHEIGEVRFYTMYGHLNSNHIVEVGQTVNAGEHFANIGESQDSGGWFTHTHLQILTEKAMQEGRSNQGYIAKKDLDQIENLFPSPYFLFRPR